ncbi:DUF456 domain-containing protein [Salinibacillus xinjiangensis]|uniref:DUF456 family protein n=1 Tax=Salinibacillus xinjiangensis TaxID=1229268 RepID=A0A6G1X4U1_9BACI|nr:DUF456 domain-containing protein [Salinibacillus xinjiangensis]MRG85848.1 DUF456 family protein [Salinibacillus xinjiangensis]
MVDILLWILILVLFILSFVGIVFPIIPSVLVIWGGFLLYHFAINGETLSWFFWIPMVMFTIILFVADIIVNSHFVKRFGGSKWGERVAAIAVIVGSFIVPPFGIIIIPFVAVFITELIQRRTAREAIKASVGSLLGFLGSSVAKVIIQLVMIIWFFLDVWINF